ncbi:MAG: hypothetical protein QG657_1189 [Acidobacteriota bacterium]|nr:hypothetical protein [Acidobacteriota bacterium]
MEEILKTNEPLEEQLTQGKKMETLGILASGIAHDFKNILTIIIGFTELALDDQTNHTRVKRNMEEVLLAAHRGKDLVQQILSYSRKSEKENRPVNVNSMVKEVLKMLCASLPASIEIHHDISDVMYEVFADPSQLHQVLMNLCTNAVYAMQENGGRRGRLEVILTDLSRDLVTISEGNPTPSPYLRLTVSDTGHGMTPEVMKHIFDPFFTTKKDEGGTGLGLSIVQGIVKNLDGEITVESEPGKGTSFHVFLPIYEKEAVEEEKEEQTIPGGKEHILLVDDKVALVNMCRKLLEKLGYEVIPCIDSIEALRIFCEDPRYFDLVITELTMPGISGKQLAQELINIKPDIPVILSTGFTREMCREDFSAVGIKSFLLKPYNNEELARVVRKVLDQ